MAGMAELLNVLGETPVTTSPRTRDRQRLLTDPAASEIWSAVSASLHRYLRSRGLSVAAAEDVVQEVAVRAMRCGVDYDSAGDLIAWCIVVARNLHIDEVRRSRGCLSLEELKLDQAPGLVDVVVSAEQRMALQVLVAELSTWRTEDRELLFAERTPAGTTSKAEANRTAVRRHRLRQKLARAISGVLAGLGVLDLRARKLALLGTPAVALMCVTIAVLPQHAPSVPGAIAQPLGRSGVHPGMALVSDVPSRRQSPPVLPARPRGAHVQGAQARRAVTTVNPDGKHPVYVTEREKKPEDHLLCVDHLIVVPDMCVG